MAKDGRRNEAGTGNAAARLCNYLKASTPEAGSAFRSANRARVRRALPLWSSMASPSLHLLASDRRGIAVTHRNLLFEPLR